MTIRFAAAASRHQRIIGRVFRARLRLAAANDNGGTAVHDRILVDALRLFARHGLHAAAHARDEAASAHEAGDAERRERWLAVCRTLDRRMAARLATRTAGTP